MVAPQPTTFKLFWILAAVFASLNALLVAAADPNEPSFWVGGLLPDEVVHNHVYNFTWGGSGHPSNMSLLLA
ncbi:hypothetical protein QFC24_007039 [Naganishia onofrii]|uniref:Uncharacterized protein n=1 Tax=Naganishia onofrii TaxID=1851511 RepID=A0ACC2WU77_9TREE|nr:hypothetical protein QFC24_007039 [Naganishia onofrii]